VVRATYEFRPRKPQTINHEPRQQPIADSALSDSRRSVRRIEKVERDLPGWRPGSTLYLAWQQNRESFEPVGEFGLGRDLSSLFKTAPNDVFLIKVSYWFNP
jgi:hypothetical protein